MESISNVHYVLLQLGIILFWALTLGSLFERFGLPGVLGYTLAGYTIGPNGLGLVGYSDIVQLLADLGITLLLFYIGLEFSFRKLVESGSHAMFLSPVRSGLAFLLGFLSAKILGFSHIASLVAGATVAVSSTGIISNNILERNLQHTIEARVMMAMLILEDLLSVVFLAFLLSQGGGLSVPKIFLHTLIVLVLVLTIGVYLSRFFFRLIKRLGHQDKITLYALGLLVIFSYGVSLLGISPALGAFFAGVALSEAAAASRIERELEMLKKFLVLIFFTSIGLYYSPVFTTRGIIMALLLLLAELVALVTTSIFAPFIGMPLKSSARLLILGLPIGEFSLFFAATATAVGVPGASEILGSIFILIFLTSILSHRMFAVEEKVIEMIKARIPYKSRVRTFLNFLDKEKPSPHRDVEYSNRVKMHLERIAINLIALLSIGYLIGYFLTEIQISPQWVVLIGLILSVYPIYAIVVELLKMFTFHMEKIMKMFLPKMDYFERKVAAKKASVMALGILIYLVSIVMNIVAQVGNIVTFQTLAFIFLVVGILSFIYGALNLLSFFVLR